MILQTACGCLVEPVVIFQPRRGGLLSNQKTAYTHGQMVAQHRGGQVTKQTIQMYAIGEYAGHVIKMILRAGSIVVPVHILGTSVV